MGTNEIVQPDAFEIIKIEEARNCLEWALFLSKGNKPEETWDHVRKAMDCLREACGAKV